LLKFCDKLTLRMVYEFVKQIILAIDEK